MINKKHIMENRGNQETLTAAQMRVQDLRKRINRRDLEAEKIQYYTKYKNLTYAWIFVFPPYGWHRLWRKDTEFQYQEKVLLTMISLVYLVSLFLHLFTGMAFW